MQPPSWRPWRVSTRIAFRRFDRARATPDAWAALGACSRRGRGWRGLVPARESATLPNCA